jgi:Sulfotransferase family
VPLEDAGPVDVVYVAGYGRSGSTLLGKMLGELDRSVYVGELNFLWTDGILGSRSCGCGRPVKECPRWRRILQQLGHDPDVLADEMADLLARTTRTRHGLLGLIPFGIKRLESNLGRVADRLAVLYRAIAEEFDADVIIDSSKSPMYRRALERADGVAVHNVHLVRDPRAAADSWRRPKRESSGAGELPRYGLARSAVLWTVTNLLAARPAPAPRTVRVRYEDLIEDPQARLDSIGCQLNLDTAGIAISADRRVALGPNHSIAGNPNRFDTGTVALQADDEWQRRVNRREYALVTTLCLPALKLFGYRVRR